MRPSLLAIAVALAFFACVPGCAHAADAVPPAASGASGAGTDKRMEVHLPSASAAKSAIEQAASQVGTAVEHAASAVAHEVEKADAAAGGRRTTTTITTGGASAPIVIRQETR